MKNIILASGSPRRRELLEQIGLEFKIITSNAIEDTDKVNPAEMVMELSALKAEAVFNELTGQEKSASVIIGADTIVYAKGSVLGKPKSEEDAFAMIKMLSGNVHSVYTGVTILENGQIKSFFEETKVKVYDMSDEEINRYIQTGDCMDKAGAYGIQGAFAAFVEKIDGDYNNVVGLPVARLYHEMRKAGII